MLFLVVPPEIFYVEMSGTRETESVVLSNVGIPAPSVEAPPAPRPGPSVDHQYERVPDFRSYENVPVTDGYQDPVTAI